MSFPSKVVYDYSKLKSGMIGFSHGCDLLGDIIALGQAPGKDNLQEATHAFFFYEVHGQIVAAEIQKNGFDLDSIDANYCGTKEQIVKVYEWDSFNDPAMLDRFNQFVAKWFVKNQNEGYSFGDAIISSPVGKSLLGWLIKPSNKNEFCSGDVYTILKNFDFLFPIGWGIVGPDPLALQQYLAQAHHITEITAFKKVV